MALTDDTLRLNIDINGSKARKELGTLEQSTKGLQATNKNLRLELKKLEAAGKANTNEYGRLQKQIRENNATIRTNKSRMEVLRKEVGLNGLTAKQLRTEYRKLKQAMDSTTPGTAAWKNYNKQLNAVKGRMDQVNTGSKRAGRSFGIFRELLPIAGVGALVGVLKGAVSELFNLAKVMEADSIRSSQVFGDNLGYVTEQAEQLAAKMGLTTREFVAAATATGDLLIPLDFTREQAAEMSVELQSLSGALDEWTGGQYGAAGVSQILTKAMLGENEQLKQLGIAIRQDSDEYKDLVKQKEAAGNVTKAQAQALATLELIQRKSTDAQAAYNREGNKLLRMQKSVTAWWKQMKENVVEYLNSTREARLFDDLDVSEKRIESFDNESSALSELLVTYDSLQGKTNLTKDEQGKLNDAIRKIGEIVPGAISEVDKYGNAISINKDKIIEAREAQRLLNVEMQSEVIDDISEQIESYNSIIENSNRVIQEKQELLKNESVIDKAAAYSKVDRAVVEENFRKTNIKTIKQQNAILEENNKKLATSLLKLREIGLSDEDLANRTGLSIERIQQAISDYVKAVSGEGDKPKSTITLAPKIDTSSFQDEFERSLAEMDKMELDLIDKGLEQEFKDSYAKQLAVLEQNLHSKKITEDEYRSDVLRADLTFLKKKLEYLENGSVEYEETLAQFLKKQADVDEAIKERMITAQQELTEARLQNMSEGVAKEQAMEQARWESERENLAQQVIQKEELSEQELAYNETVYALIEEKERAHQQRMREIKFGVDSEGSEFVDATNELGFVDFEHINEYYEQKNSLIEAQYKREQQLAGDNQAALAAAEKRYSQQMIALNQEQAQSRYDLAQTNIQTGQQYLSALSGLVSQESSMGMALFGLQKALAIGEIWVNIAKANAKAIAASPLTGGQPWVSANYAMGAVQTALVTAQAVGHIVSMKKSSNESSSSKQELPGLQSGGYAERDASDSTPVGIYHANEFIASAPAVRNPTIKPFLDIIDIAQKNGSIAQLDLTSVMGGRSVPGRQQGGYANAPAPTQNITLPYSDPEMTNSLNRLNSVLDRIEANGVQGVWSHDYFKKSMAKMDRIERDVQT
jgi:hypothetical protein